MKIVTELKQKSIQPFEEKYRGKTVLAVGSHPTDIETGAGGTLARLCEGGSKLILMIVCIPGQLERRVEEVKAAGRHLGATEIRFLLPEKEYRVEDLKSYELVEHMDKLVREVDPAVVFTHAASNFHLDNVLVHKALAATQRLHFFDMFCFYPTNCHPVTTPFQPNVFVDITATMDRKMAAINRYESYLSCREGLADFYANVVREYGRFAGTKYAEAFEIGRLIYD